MRTPTRQNNSVSTASIASSLFLIRIVPRIHFSPRGQQTRYRLPVMMPSGGDKGEFAAADTVWLVWVNWTTTGTASTP